MRGTAREYFYTIDLRGRLWHAGSELSDARFLRSFFQQLQPNTTGRHPEYPYISPCGAEMNYVYPADTPIVFQRLQEGCLWYAGELSVPFAPQKLRFSAEGVLYHPAPVGVWGRLAPEIALELGQAAEPWGLYFLLRVPGHPCGAVVLPLDMLSDVQYMPPPHTFHCSQCRAPNPELPCLHFLYFPNTLRVETWLPPHWASSALTTDILFTAVYSALLQLQQLFKLSEKIRNLQFATRSSDIAHVREELHLVATLDLPPPTTTLISIAIETTNGKPIAGAECAIAAARPD
ncbi:MAG: DUF4505 family protein [Candidatus Kapabacteria bacterium]|nr:DUF4505 family protein [Candidatus Kapabacteria bacterium]MCS7169817.1 DUF4505 family protein [Candidatus Kapabacteria bacterium]MDW7996981.1 DUF4505 family protein [Bacteroidota bacterium]MDW8225423.1 DUF4505 family protein [Bacteroidota bacterium]